ncbi:hypothetical protein BH23VER1_BH23VER1_03950 [soil metagenome]
MVGLPPMIPITNRRSFLKGAALASAGEFAFLRGLAPVGAAEVEGVRGAVRMRAEIEPVVRLIEETARERLLEEVGARIRSGALSYQQVLAGLQLAGVKHIEPRPVGFKFHAVLVVNSAHLASIASPDSERWLPIFWALDYFKSSQQQDANQGDWTMSAVDEARVPAGDRARAAFVEAMEAWDVAGADAAVAGLARTAGADEAFELFARFGARDFRDIGHKAIFVANGFRTLENIGWQHAEPVLRSLAYALLAHEGDNPAERDADVDRPWRENLGRAEQIPDTWQAGRDDPAAVEAELLPVLREGDSGAASGAVLELLRAGVGPRSVWDVLLGFSGELLMRRPDILTLHAVTSANALYYAYRTVGDDHLRRMLLLQEAAFLPFFRRSRESIAGSPLRIDNLEPSEDGEVSVDSIFEAVGRDGTAAARRVLGFCAGDAGRAGGVIDEARRYLFLKGRSTHDYKFTSAVLEDYHHLSPAIRDRFLAASVFNLKGAGDRDNDLVGRVRAALG